MTFADTPTLGMYIGVPVIGLLLLASAAVLAFAVFWFRNGDSWDRESAMFFAGGALLVGGLTGLIGLAAMWPLKHDYHFYKPVKGTVERVSSRLIGGDEGTNQRFVLVIGGVPYGVDDTRASLAKEGDAVNLACKKEFDWGSEDGWACKWKGAGRV